MRGPVCATIGLMEWTGQVYADKPTVAVSTHIDAAPDAVWELVSDIHLMPRLSSELQEVAWLDGATEPAIGHRFAGRNRHRAIGEWKSVSTVVEADAPNRFAWAIGDPEFPSSIWRFSIRDEDRGCTLEQWVQLGPGPSGLSSVIDAMPDKEQSIVFMRLREFEAAIQSNLAAIKDLAEQGA